MAIYRYRAVSATGARITGEMEAVDRATVIDRLREQGHFPVSAEESSGPALARWLTRDIRRGGLRARDLAGATRSLSTLLRAGVPLDHALGLLVDTTDVPAARQFFGKVRQGVQRGLALSDALAAQDDERALPRFYISLVRAGEAGDTVDVVLGRLADHLDRVRSMTERVRSALIYPVLLLFVAALTVVILMTVVLPEFRPLIESSGARLSLHTRLLFGFSDAMAAFWWALPTGLLAAVLAARRILARPEARERWDRALLRAPLVGTLLLKIEVARLARTLGMLIGSGLQELGALTTVQDVVGNRFLQSAVRSAAAELRGGRLLSDALARAAAFPSLYIRMIRIGEESGRLEEMLGRLADIYDQDTQRILDRLLALLVPGLTIVLGLFIAGIITSVMGAILSLNETAL